MVLIGNLINEDEANLEADLPKLIELTNDIKLKNAKFVARFDLAMLLGGTAYEGSVDSYIEGIAEV